MELPVLKNFILVVLASTLFLAHTAQAALVVNPMGPYSIVAGAAPLEMFSTVTGISGPPAILGYNWSINAVNVSLEANVTLSWLDLLSATNGGALGDYSVVLDVTDHVSQPCYLSTTGGWRDSLVCPPPSLVFESAQTTLTITSPNPVPVPAAVWLFGTALIGLVGFGNRRKAA